MRKWFCYPLVAAAALFLAACDFEDLDFGGTERHTQDFHYSYPLQAGGRLTLENFNGSVEISGWDQPTVDISGTKYASSPTLLDALRIDVEHGASAVYIRTVRPTGGRSNMGARYAIKVPRKVELERVVSSNGTVRLLDIEGAARVRTSNGGIEAQRVAGSVELHTSNGKVRASGMRGPVRIDTSNGSVDLTVPAGFRHDVRVATSNGGIVLHLPETLDARLQARTSNASIHSDYEVKSSGTWDKHRLDGVIGNGGPLLDLTTSNGGIRLAKL
jgi:hypothetical protein